MREFKGYVAYGTDGKVISIEPIKKSDSDRPTHGNIMVIRVLSQDEVDREASECMQQDCHTYKRENNRIKQVR